LLQVGILALEGKLLLAQWGRQNQRGHVYQRTSLTLVVARPDAPPGKAPVINDSNDMG
jgi:hypothetical protein